MDMMKTFEDKYKAETNLLIAAYIGCGEFLKAKADDEKRRCSTDMNDWTAEKQLAMQSVMQSVRIEEGLCNYEAAINHDRKWAAELQKQEYDDSLSGNRLLCSVGFARNLLQHSADNKTEAFAIFQQELDLCVDPLLKRGNTHRRGYRVQKAQQMGSIHPGSSSGLSLYHVSAWHDATSSNHSNRSDLS